MYNTRMNKTEQLNMNNTLTSGIAKSRYFDTGQKNNARSRSLSSFVFFFSVGLKGADQKEGNRYDQHEGAVPRIQL